MSFDQSDDEQRQQQTQIRLSSQRFDPFPPGLILPPLPEPSSPIPPITLLRNCQNFNVKSNSKNAHPEQEPEHRLHPLIVCILDLLFTVYFWIRRLFPYKTPSRYRRPDHLRAQPIERQEERGAIHVEKRGKVRNSEEENAEVLEIENKTNDEGAVGRNIERCLRIEQWRNYVEEETEKQRRAVEVDIERGL